MSLLEPLVRSAGVGCQRPYVGKFVFQIKRDGALFADVFDLVLGGQHFVFAHLRMAQTQHVRDLFRHHHALAPNAFQRRDRGLLGDDDQALAVGQCAGNESVPIVTQGPSRIVAGAGHHKVEAPLFHTGFERLELPNEHHIDLFPQTL